MIGVCRKRTPDKDVLLGHLNFDSITIEIRLVRMAPKWLSFQSLTMDRRDMPFVAVICGGIPSEIASSLFFGHTKGTFTGADSDREGYLGVAQGSTLFWGKIGNLSYEMKLKDMEKDKMQISLALEKTKGNINRVATLLGISRTALYGKLKRGNLNDYFLALVFARIN